MHRSTVKVLLLSAAVITTGACGKKKKDKTGRVQVGFANGTTVALALDGMPAGSTGADKNENGSYPTYAATTYGMKIVQIYLNEDVAEDGWSNKGTNAYIWINPACETQTEEDGSIKIANNGQCDTKKITTYFNLARPTAQVNADLNAQQIPVPAQTYRYIRMELCDQKNSDNNVQVASTSGGLTTPAELRTSGCVIAPAKINPPLEVSDGGSVTISLAYDLSKALVDYNYDSTTNTSTGGSASSTCALADDGQGIRCLGEVVFTPTVQ